MKGLTCLLVLLAVFASAQSENQPQSSVVWTQEPDSFRNIPWNTAEKPAKKIADFDDCFDFKGRRVCTLEFTIGEKQISSYFNFKNNQFAYVLASFDSDDYEFLKTSFVEKYGKPSTEKTEELTTRMGVKYQNETLFWMGPKIIGKLERYGSNVTEGSITIGLRIHLEEMGIEDKEKAKKAAEDF